ncbi:GNAT family N-acetyltransferase [Sphingorhabdus soli]|uniref:GNAT family N-acetyltransferase n=1 Tax=Flavisphingopyxis soli TaxID=2601267 RepID=A0A5C6UK98_9SPHN|nr:GNAT family N-acetyltransferase [Sphingorhabdus soli]TXC73472.1 GNAT family N-acetyltransferase [Sphingorhabdus soli]
MAAIPDLQPTLIGQTIDLRPTVASDWDGLFAVASDPAIWAVHPAHDRWQEPVFRKFFDDALASRGALTVRDKASGTIIGSSRYSTERAPTGEIEIGWSFLARDYWGGATNKEMKRLMLDYAFRWFDPVIFVVGDTNIRSRKAMEKIGGVLTDRVDERVMAGETTRHVIYEMRRPLDWPT